MKISLNTILSVIAVACAMNCSAAEQPGRGADANAQLLGKKLYAAHCLACHGKRGKGDGDAAISLLRRPADLSDPSMWDDEDDDVLAVITNGRRTMPKFKKMLDESQRLAVLKFMRTLAPKPPPQNPQKKEP
jgi:mono/diheme cytochrome c family protein